MSSSKKLYNPKTGKKIKDTPKNRAMLDRYVKAGVLLYDPKPKGKNKNNYIKTGVRNIKRLKKLVDKGELFVNPYTGKHHLISERDEVGKKFKKRIFFNKYSGKFERTWKRNILRYEKKLKIERENTVKERNKYVYHIRFMKWVGKGIEAKFKVVKESYYGMKKHFRIGKYEKEGMDEEEIVRTCQNPTLVSDILNMRQSDQYFYLEIVSVEEIDFFDKEASPLRTILRASDQNNLAIATYKNIMGIKLNADKGYYKRFDVETPKEYQNNGCFYNAILTACKYGYDKVMKTPLTKEIIKKVCGIKRDDWGMTIEEASLFMEKHKIKFFVFDAKMELIYKHIPEKGECYWGKRSLYFIKHNDHSYLIMDKSKIKSLNAQQIKFINKRIEYNQETPEIDNKYSVRERNFVSEECRLCNTKEEVIGLILNAGDLQKNLSIVYTDESLIPIIQTLLYDFGITVNVYGRDNINRFGIILEGDKRSKSLLPSEELDVSDAPSLPKEGDKKKEKEDGTKEKSQYFISVTCNPMLNDLESADEYIQYQTTYYLLHNKLINKKNKSYYSDSLQQHFKNYKRYATIGNLRNDVNLDEKYDMIDWSKSYSSILNEIEYFPLFNVFDKFVDYKEGDEILAYSLYIIRNRKNCEFIDHLIFDTEYVMVYGGIVKKLLSKGFALEISEVCKPMGVEPNPYYQKVREFYESGDLDNSLYKRMFNTIIGMFGKRINKQSTFVISKSKDDVVDMVIRKNNLQNAAIPTKLTEEGDDRPIWAYNQRVRSEYMVDGFFPITYLILDIQRFKCWSLAKFISKKASCVAVNTDCIYFEKGILNAESIKNYVGFGGLRFESEKELTYKNVFYEKFGVSEGENRKSEGGKIYCVETPSLSDNDIRSNSFPKESESECGFGLDLLPDYDMEEETITLKDEWNLLQNPEIYGLERVLLTASFAGCGKSYFFKTILPNEKTLFITPYNVLSLEILKESLKALTMNRLTNQYKGVRIKCEDETKIWKYDKKDIECIVFEEIYSYDVSSLQLIYHYMEKHPEFKYYANGDLLQLPPIDMKVSKEYQDYCIRQMFPKNIHLQICKRMKGESERLKQIKDDIFKHKIPLIDIVYKYFKVVEMKDVTTTKNICYLNTSCVIVNNHIRKKQNKDDTLRRGDSVICKKRWKDKQFTFHINNVYQVKKVKDKKVTLYDDLYDESYDLEYPVVASRFRFDYSYTAHSVQGLTIKGQYITIFDVNLHYITREWFWVAITRANRLQNVRFCLKQLDDGKLQNITGKIAGYKQQDKKRFGNKFNLDDDRYVDEKWIRSKFTRQLGRCVHKKCRHSKMNTKWNLKGCRQQYTVDRVDNKLPHYKKNCVLSCLACNESLR